MKIAIAVIGVIVWGLISAYSALLVYVNLPMDRVLARHVSVTRDWPEIDVDKPFTSEHLSQSVALDIDDIAWPSAFDGIHRTTGEILHPEVEVIDQRQHVQPLRLSGFSQKYWITAEYRPASDSGSFGTGRKFTRIRIRSDIPFECRRISWVDYDPE